MEPAKESTIIIPFDDFNELYFKEFQGSSNPNNLYQINIIKIQNELKRNTSSQVLAIYAGMSGFSEWVAQPNKLLFKNECELQFTYAVFTFKLFIEGGENLYCNHNFNEKRNSIEKVHKKAVEIIINPKKSILFLCGHLFDPHSNISKTIEIPKEIISLILLPNLKLLNFDEFKKAIKL